MGGNDCTPTCALLFGPQLPVFFDSLLGLLRFGVDVVERQFRWRLVDVFLFLDPAILVPACFY